MHRIDATEFRLECSTKLRLQRICSASGRCNYLDSWPFEAKPQCAKQTQQRGRGYQCIAQMQRGNLWQLGSDRKTQASYMAATKL